MEIDPAYMRRRIGAAAGIGVVSFAAPFVVASLAAYALLDWGVRASLIAGMALSTTSLAVVYAVLVGGLTQTNVGKLLNDLVALRAQRRDHRPDAVLAARDGRGPVGGRADGDRRALAPSGRRAGAPRRPPPLGGAERGVCLGGFGET
jgi:hypothetical protein